MVEVDSIAVSLFMNREAAMLSRLRWFFRLHRHVCVFHITGLHLCRALCRAMHHQSSFIGHLLAQLSISSTYFSLQGSDHFSLIEPK